VINGWAAIRCEIEKAIKVGMPTGSKVTQRNVRARVSSGMAWLTYDQRLIKPAAEGPTILDSHQARVLEKVGRDWKIIYLSWVYCS
jgi:hypothetical protein